MPGFRISQFAQYHSCLVEARVSVVFRVCAHQHTHPPKQFSIMPFYVNMQIFGKNKVARPKTMNPPAVNQLNHRSGILHRIRFCERISPLLR
jgi:hypothetical protein